MDDAHGGDGDGDGRYDEECELQDGAQSRQDVDLVDVSAVGVLFLLSVSREGPISRGCAWSTTNPPVCRTGRE